MKGPNYVEGRIEIYHDGQWGTICDHYFDLNHKGANVVCRMMGYDFGLPGHEYKQKYLGNSPKMWLDDVKCEGTETDIRDCPHRDWGSHNCNTLTENSAIRCYRSGMYRNFNLHLYYRMVEMNFAMHTI